MAHKFESCSLCYSKIIIQRTELNYKYNGVNYTVRNVPVGLCNQCGEMYLVAHMSKLIERLVRIDKEANTTDSNRIITIPNNIAGF